MLCLPIEALVGGTGLIGGTSGSSAGYTFLLEEAWAWVFKCVERESGRPRAGKGSTVPCDPRAVRACEV